MSNTQQELPAGSVALPVKVQARIQARLANIQNIQEQAQAAIQAENAFIVESIESFKDAVGVEGQFALLNDASYLVPHVTEEAITETHDADSAERTHNNEGDKIGGDCPSETSPVAEAETETADVAETTVAAEVGLFEEEIAQAEQEVHAEQEAAPIAEQDTPVSTEAEETPSAV